MSHISPVTPRTVAHSSAAPAPADASSRPARRRSAAQATTFERAAVVSGGGSSMSVQERFATLTKRFLPEKAKGVDARFQFDLSGSGGGKWYVEIKGGKITVKEGSGPNPTVTLKASAEDYLKIANGEMSKTWAFIRGKVKVDGDRDVLGKFDQYFKDPK